MLKIIDRVGEVGLRLEFRTIHRNGLTSELLPLPRTETAKLLCSLLPQDYTTLTMILGSGNL